MSKLIAKVSRGPYKGTHLYAHKNEAGKYVASPSRFESDYIYVDNEDELEALVLSGLKVRMSNPTINNAPSLIAPQSIQKDDGSVLCNKLINLLPKISSEADLEYDSKSKSRKEQDFLRLHLTQGKDEGKCILCGEIYPTNFLVAAHIKPRSLCEKSEKLDFDNIAALMCKIGCDDLFEKGYIIVNEGIIIDNSIHKKTTPMLNNLINKLTDKSVSNWIGSSKYYIAHKEHHNSKPKKSTT